MRIVSFSIKRLVQLGAPELDQRVRVRELVLLAQFFFRLEITPESCLSQSNYFLDPKLLISGNQGKDFRVSQELLEIGEF
ncbi:MAG: hypothetical protein ACI8T1_001054 [Verrucomicrobiales bacterium]|jgi:hypothetical protein